jgi:hypothetical protein
MRDHPNDRQDPRNLDALDARGLATRRAEIREEFAVLDAAAPGAGQNPRQPD